MAPKDPYLYEGTNILINKLNIRDHEILEKFEADSVIRRIAQIEDMSKFQNNNFDAKYFKDIHKHIFQDVYSWAGEPRTINMYKAEPILGGVSVDYSDHKSIDKNLNTELKKLNLNNWNELSLHKKVECFTRGIANIWKIHAFREGNTRTVITFASLYAKANGFPLDKDIFKKHRNIIRNALVMASIGKYSEPKYLEKIFLDAIERGGKQLNERGNTKDVTADDGRQAGVRKEVNSSRRKKDRNSHEINGYSQGITTGAERIEGSELQSPSRSSKEYNNRYSKERGSAQGNHEGNHGITLPGETDRKAELENKGDSIRCSSVNNGRDNTSNPGSLSSDEILDKIVGLLNKSIEKFNEKEYVSVKDKNKTQEKTKPIER